jgi:hypothetical protein
MTDDNSAWRETVRHAFEIWFDPEVERRRVAGQLGQDFQVWAAQAVMNVGQPTVVRLNEEIKALLKVKLDRDVTKGDPALWSDLKDIQDLELGSTDANAGHLTVIRSGPGWFLAFDFRYNANRANDLLDAAREFAKTAEEAWLAERLRAFAENLFAAVELAVKATLLTLPDEDLLKTKRHGVISGKYNRWAKVGNAEKAHAKLLNRLAELRDAARYVSRPFTLSPDEGNGMLEGARSILADAELRIPARRPPIAGG